MAYRNVRQFLDRITKRQLIIGGIVLGVWIVGGIVALTIAYQKREVLLATTLAKMQTRLADDYQIDLAIGNAYFSGLTTVTFEQVSITPHDRDQLAGIAEASVSVRLFPLLTGDVKFGQLRVQKAHIQLIKKDSISNYDFFFREPDTLHQEQPRKQAETTTINMAQAANRMLNSILYKIPKNMELRDFLLTYRDDSLRQRISVPNADIDHGKLTSAVNLNDNKAVWQVSGQLNPSERQLYIKVHANGQKIALPLLEQKFGLKLSFDTVETRLREVYWTNNEFLHIKGEWAVKNLNINHWRIA